MTVPPSEEIQTISGAKWQPGPILGKGAFGILPQL